jgi:hypothetical protein
MTIELRRYTDCRGQATVTMDAVSVVDGQMMSRQLAWWREGDDVTRLWERPLAEYDPDLARRIAGLEDPEITYWAEIVLAALARYAAMTMGKE